MTTFWISILRDHYAPLEARSLRASFMEGAPNCGITIVTDEPARNMFKFRVAFNGGHDQLCDAAQTAAGAQGSIVPTWHPNHDNPTVLIRYTPGF